MTSRDPSRPPGPDVALLRIDVMAGIPYEFADLVAESEGEGFRFLRRLQREWSAGTLGTFAGEAFFGAWEGQRLVAVGGVTRDPYVPGPGIGRLRHVYVTRVRRGRGVGRQLVGQILAYAAKHYDVIRLRTDTADADLFYRRLGFTLTRDADATHELHLSAPA